MINYVQRHQFRSIILNILEKIMEKPIRLAILVFCLALAIPGKAAAPHGWLTDFEKAKQEARKTGRQILVLFTGSDWCGWCMKLRNEVLETAEFRDSAKKTLVLVYIDFPRKNPLPPQQQAANQELRRQLKYYGGYPGTVVLDKNGQPLGQISGYRGREFYLNTLKALQKNAGNASAEPRSSAAKQTPGGSGAPEGWLTDFEKAKQEAQKTGRRILVLFTGSDWCGWCKKLKAETLDTKDFKDFAGKQLVLLYVDFPRNKTIPAELKAHNQRLRKQLLKNGGYPTTLLLDKNGKEITRIIGYTPQYRQKIENILHPVPALVRAARNNDPDEVKAQLSAGSSVNSTDGTGTTALHNAAYFGNLEMLKLLMEKGAGIEVKNNRGMTPLLSACGSPFSATDVLDCLIAAGANLKAADNDGRTALIFSIVYQKTDFVKKLLEQDADINQANLYGMTPLALAAGRGNYTIVKLLLDRGARTEKTDRHGLAPLHHAAHSEAGSLGIVKLLLKGGAAPDAKTSRGETPYDIAKKSEIKEFLRRYQKK